MARLASLQKGGFYATPPRVTGIVASWVEARPGARLLDPFAGEGEALCTLAQAWRCIPYAVELHQGRCEATARRVEALGGQARHGPAEFLETSDESFDCLYLNPPYHEQTEAAYVLHLLPLLAPGGLVIAVLPEATVTGPGFLHALVKMVESVVVRRFPPPEYERFEQVVVVGRRRTAPVESWEHLGLTRAAENAVAGGIPAMQPGEFRFALPASPAPDFEMKLPGTSEALAQAANEGVTAAAAWPALTQPAQAGRVFRPLEPPKPGHAAMLIAAGVLDGTRIDTPGGALLVKGRSRKYVESAQQRQDDTVIETETERMAVEIHALNLDTGDLEGYTSREPGPYQDFVARHAGALQAELDRRNQPLFDPGMLDRYLPDLARYHAPGVLPGRARDDLLPAQRAKAAALAHSLRVNKSVVLVGEMGTGVRHDG